ncbi:MAG TPA: DUF3617 domain-containing protein [Allosphingosinicella sp.]
MRFLMMIPLLAAAACSEGAEQPKAAPAPKAEALQAGQWQTTAEVIKLIPLDKGKPRIATPAGTRIDDSVCLSEAEVKKPNPKLFAGSKDSCEYSNFYMSKGTFNASMRCNRPGLDGQLMTTVYGDYTQDSFEMRLDVATRLASDGDVNVSSKLTGRRVGPCTAG